MRCLISVAVLPLLTLLLLPLAAQAQVYKWRDATGKIHYSDKPPAGTPAQGRKLGPANSVNDDMPAARRTAADQRLDAATRASDAKEKAASAERERAEDAQRDQACERARVNLQGLESGQIRFRMGTDGEREGLDGAVRETELHEARRSVDANCSPRPAPPAKPGK
jgi:hypothetical protein